MVPWASVPNDSSARAIPVPLKAPTVERSFGVGDVTPLDDGCVGEGAGPTGVGTTGVDVAGGVDVVELNSASISSMLRCRGSSQT